ncbi:hypothetical protein HDU84_007494 [Entophlyctis sp. JEL0112]|nr:hypothetical protein HDU84_007494 [Entophlyctis sp. JEL0112]
MNYNGFIPRIPVKPDFLVFHVITRTFYYLLQFGWPFLVFDSSTAFSKRMAFSFGPAMVFSFLFMLNTQVNHLSPSAMDPHRAKTRDWTVHQVITAQNFGDPEGDGVAWWFHFILSGGLNLQMEHHLFPTVNHCHLRAVSVILKDECRRHGIPYNQVSGYIEAMCEYVKHSKNAVSLDGLSETKDTNLSQ